MTSSILLLIFGVLVPAFYMAGYQRAKVLSADGSRLKALPVYYSGYTAVCCLLPGLLVVGLWTLLEAPVVDWLVRADFPETYRHMSEGQQDLILNKIKNLVASGNLVEDEFTALVKQMASLQEISFWSKRLVTALICLLGGFLGWNRIKPQFNARSALELQVRILLWLCASIAVFTTIGIILSVLFEAIRFFQSVPITDFIFGLEWSPQIALRADQQGSSGSFGTVPLFAGTFLISLIAMIIAVPVGLMSAIYLSEYASRTVRDIIKPLLEILAGIPTVVYGFFAALTVAPVIRGWGESYGLDIASESALAAGIVMGIMIIPFISSLSDDIINAVPQALRDGSYALGATPSETIRLVVVPAALPGIAGGVLLGLSRAIGETMIVVMAAGMTAKLTANPFEAVTTVTVQIVTLLVGDQEFDSPKTLAAFALGLLLFVTTLILNIIAVQIVKKYREQYD